MGDKYQVLLNFIGEAHDETATVHPQTAAPSRALAVARTKLDEARMWVEEARRLEAIGA